MLDEKQIFSKRLNYFMNLNGKSQSDLINELGINKSTISTWCNGSKMPRMGTIQTLADYFGIMKSDLIDEKPVTNINDELDDKSKLLIQLYQEFDESKKDDLLKYARFLEQEQNQ